MRDPRPQADPVSLAQALMTAHHEEMREMENQLDWADSRTHSAEHDRDRHKKQAEKLETDLKSANNKIRTLESQYDTVSKLAQNSKAALDKEAAIVVAVREALTDLPGGVEVAIAIGEDKGIRQIMAVLQRIQGLVNKENADG